MKPVLLAMLLCLFTACATTVPVVITSGSASADREQFCRLAAERGLQMRADIESKSNGVAIGVQLASCDMLASDLGRVSYLIHSSSGGSVISRIEFVALMALINGSWTVIHQGPIYEIDYLNKTMQWLIQELPEAGKTGKLSKTGTEV